jgi:hypothetical protein
MREIAVRGRTPMACAAFLYESLRVGEQFGLVSLENTSALVFTGYCRNEFAPAFAAAVWRAGGWSLPQDRFI